MVTSLLGAAGEDFFQKVRTAALFVRDKVRYVDVDAGSGGNQPHARPRPSRTSMATPKTR
jgi:hypothetical protein